MSLLPEIRKELVAAAGRHVGRDGIAARGRRWRDSVSAVLVIALVVIVVAAVGAVLLSVHGGGQANPAIGHGGGGSVPPRAVERLVAAATRQVLAQDPACRPQKSTQPRFLVGPSSSQHHLNLGSLRTPAPPAQRMSLSLLRTFSVPGRWDLRPLRPAGEDRRGSLLPGPYEQRLGPANPACPMRRNAAGGVPKARAATPGPGAPKGR